MRRRGNRACVDQLEQLARIGPSRLVALMKYRARLLPRFAKKLVALCKGELEHSNLLLLKLDCRTKPLDLLGARSRAATTGSTVGAKLSGFKFFDEHELQPRKALA